MKKHPKIALPIRLAILFLIQGALTVGSLSLFVLHLLLVGGLIALIAAYFAVDCKSDCVRWWLLLLPGQYIANMLLLYFAAGFFFDDPFPAIVLFFLFAQAAGVGLRKLRMRYRLTKKDFAELENPEEAEELPQKQPGLLLHPDFLRLELVSCMQGLLTAYWPVVMLFVALFIGGYVTYFLGMLCLYVVGLGLPVLMGIFAIGRVKWWLISLPVQLFVGVGAQYANDFLTPGTFAGKFLAALFFLALQAVGVGIRLLYRRLKSGRNPS